MRKAKQISAANPEIQDENTRKYKEKFQEVSESLQQQVKTLETENERLKNRVQSLQKESKEALNEYQKSLRKQEALEEELEDYKAKSQNEEKSRKLVQELKSTRKAKSPEREQPPPDFRALIDRTDEKDALYLIDSLIDSITMNITQFKQQ